MNRKYLIQKYIKFFKLKNHKELPNSSLIPENDPTVLFTTAGMQPLVPFLLGQKHPLGKRLVNVQRCIRTGDIEEVGDSYHHTFFEMLGNWSLGDYWKKEAIQWSFEFLTKELKIPIEKLAISVFSGDKKIPRDKESAKIWEDLGILKNRIAFLGKEYNWWGPTGKTGPCGPDSEMFFWNLNKKPPKKFNHKNQNWIEIWNDVFLEYSKIEIKVILVDAIKVLIDEKGNLNKELADFLKKTNKRIIIVTNAPEKRIKEKISNYDFEIFTLNRKPEKKEQAYFKKLIEIKNFDPSKTLYFDHNQKNLNAAKSFGILCKEYKNNLQIKKFIEKNNFRFVKAPQKNIDTGMGVERTVAALNGLQDNYLTDCFLPIIKKIEKISNKKYNKNQLITKSMRIIADHLKAAVFIISDGIVPSNKEQGYVLRRLIRRAIRYGREIEIKNFVKQIAEPVFEIYNDYPQLKTNKTKIIEELEKEEKKFNQTIEKGLGIFKKLIKNKEKLSGKESFLLYQSYGFPIEMIKEECQKHSVIFSEQEFKKEYQKHQQLSKTVSVGRFKSGLADFSEETTKLHTATHLLLEALKRVLKDKNIVQKGSNITSERLRLDFNFPRKLTFEEIRKIEKLVNQKIKQKLPVKKKEMSLMQAKKIGAIGSFGEKYKKKVFVYFIGDFSKEICAGPHVKNTSELGNFKIIKEESSGAGIRRIKAILKT